MGYSIKCFCMTCKKTVATDGRSPIGKGLLEVLENNYSASSSKERITTLTIKLFGKGYSSRKNIENNIDVYLDDIRKCIKEGHKIIWERI